MQHSGSAAAQSLEEETLFSERCNSDTRGRNPEETHADGLVCDAGEGWDALACDLGVAKQCRHDRNTDKDDQGHRGAPSAGGLDRQVTLFFPECGSSPSVALEEEDLCRVLLFPESQVLYGTWESLSSSSAILPRV